MPTITTLRPFSFRWLAFLGLMCATLVARSSPVKAIAAMLLGLLVACIGMENPAGTPRFTFGLTDLLGGIEAIPALVGVFAVSEAMRAMLTPEPPKLPYRRFGPRRSLPRLPGHVAYWFAWSGYFGREGGSRYRAPAAEAPHRTIHSAAGDPCRQTSYGSRPHPLLRNRPLRASSRGSWS